MYGTLPSSCYTLLAAVSGGYSWNETVMPLEGLNISYYFSLLAYFAIMIFGVANVVTSVFVESAVMSAQHHRELIVHEKQEQKEVALWHIANVFRQMDADGSGEISVDEMEYILSEPALSIYIDAIGINADNTRLLFRLLDADGSGKVDLEEFCSGCLRLQGEARSMDVHEMIYQVKQFMRKWATFARYVEDRLSRITSAETMTTANFAVAGAATSRNAPSAFSA